MDTISQNRKYKNEIPVCSKKYGIKLNLKQEWDMQTITHVGSWKNEA